MLILICSLVVVFALWTNRARMTNGLNAIQKRRREYARPQFRGGFVELYMCRTCEKLTDDFHASFYPCRKCGDSFYHGNFVGKWHDAHGWVFKSEIEAILEQEAKGTHDEDHPDL